MPTPWSSSGSLVSDRIPPPSQHRAKGKGKTPTPEPKSRAIRALEAKLDDARGSDGRAHDPKGGCFCQAQHHALSSYVPMCRGCGLVLCALNPPHYACPHCTAPLLDALGKHALTARLESELAAQVEREEAERQRAIEEAREAAGAFPVLPGSQVGRTASAASAVAAAPATRTVLSLNSGTKRVTVSSYSTPRVSSRPASRVEDREEEGRVPGPPGEVSVVTEAADPDRPWKNVRAGDMRYVQLPPETTGNTNRGKRRRN